MSRVCNTFHFFSRTGWPCCPATLCRKELFKRVVLGVVRRRHKRSQSVSLKAQNDLVYLLWSKTLLLHTTETNSCFKWPFRNPCCDMQGANPLLSLYSSYILHSVRAYPCRCIFVYKYMYFWVNHHTRPGRPASRSTHTLAPSQPLLSATPSHTRGQGKPKALRATLRGCSSCSRHLLGA